MNIIIYLHGFSSGPFTEKAIFFRQEFLKRGIALVAPDLNNPTLAALSTAAIIEKISETVQTHYGEEIYFIVSSLSAIPFLHFLRDGIQRDGRKEIKKVVMLAPCFDFFNTSLYQLELKPIEQEWLARGTFPFHSFYYQRMVPVNSHFLEDMRRYVAVDRPICVPTLIIHGTHDDIVSIELSEQFAKANKNWVQLKTVESDHRLENDQTQLFNLIWNFFDIH